MPLTVAAAAAAGSAPTAVIATVGPAAAVTAAVAATAVDVATAAPTAAAQSVCEDLQVPPPTVALYQHLIARLTHAALGVVESEMLTKMLVTHSDGGGKDSPYQRQRLALLRAARNFVEAAKCDQQYSMPCSFSLIAVRFDALVNRRR